MKLGFFNTQAWARKYFPRLNAIGLTTYATNPCCLQLLPCVAATFWSTYIWICCVACSRRGKACSDDELLNGGISRLKTHVLHYAASLRASKHVKIRSSIIVTQHYKNLTKIKRRKGSKKFRSG